jgi:hypothetical protein
VTNEVEAVEVEALEPDSANAARLCRVEWDDFDFDYGDGPFPEDYPFIPWGCEEIGDEHREDDSAEQEALDALAVIEATGPEPESEPESEPTDTPPEPAPEPEPEPPPEPERSSVMVAIEQLCEERPGLSLMAAYRIVTEREADR